MDKNKYLIVNADDFGLNEGVNRGIIECHKNGIVTSTTLMVNCPGTKDAAELAKQHPELGVGLHFNITQGMPISGKKTSLTTPAGCFLKRSQFEIKSLAGKIQLHDVEEELHLQWDMILSLGIKPTHIDSHQHIHIHPKIFELVARFAKEKNIAVRIPYEKIVFKKSPLQNFFMPTQYFSLLRKTILQFYCWQAKRYAEKIQIPANNSFVSIFSFFPKAGNATIDLYKSLLQQIQTGHYVELMCHPAHLETNPDYGTRITQISQQELYILQAPALINLIKECKIQLINYRFLLRQQSAVNS